MIWMLQQALFNVIGHLKSQECANDWKSNESGMKSTRETGLDLSYEKMTALLVGISAEASTALVMW